jgi:dephospho-CoA kinase/Zn-dependent peptidase ImmA (M78 family)
MKITEFGAGKITAQNTTQDVKPGETERQAKKLGLMNGKPRLLHKTAAKNSDPNTLMNLGIGEGVDMSSLKPFVKFCIKSLELKSVPKIIITKKKLDGTFGYYDTDAKTLTVSSSDRHLADIMRTLAHELVHLAQDEQNQDIDGSDGSKHENQANAVAGVLMRKWADKDPSLFEGQVQELKIEKPDPKDTLGVQRKDMPQVKSDDYAEFIEYLKKNGAKFTKETIPARELKAMQKEFSDEGILKQMMKNIEQGPNRKAVIASSDDYILDGHHRWLVAVNTGADLNVFRVNLPAYELYDLVNKFEKTYYKDIYSERVSIGVPFASGLVMKLFPHRPLKIAKSTPGKLRYDEVSQSQDSIGAQINFPGFEKTKVKPKPKYNPVPKKDKSILDKVKGWFTDDINEAYVLRLENDDDMLVLHIRDTKSGERVEVRGKPNYEIDYDADDELHQLLDVIGKASNISDLMNGKIVNINPKHPDGPKSYAAIEKVMGEEWSAKYKRSINCDNPKGFSQKAHCAGKKNEDVDLDEGVNDPHIFKAVFLAGGPGSGKSFVSKNILGGTGLKTMNSDDVYEILMKKQDLALDPDTIASPQGQEIRDKAKLMTKKRSVNWIDGRLGLLIDGTGKDVAKYQKQAEFLRMLGYDVAMIFVNTSEEVAQQRNRQRARSLKPEMVSAMWNDVQQNLMKFQQIFGAGRFHIIDNSGGLEDLDRQKNFDKVYNETQRFLNTPPSKPAAKKWIQNQKAQNDATQRSERTTTNNTDSDGGVGTTN